MAKKTARKISTAKPTPKAFPRDNNLCPVPTGILVLVGGAENKGDDEPARKRKPENFVKLEVLKTFAELMGKKEATVGLVTTASSEPAETLEDYKKAFKEVGITRIRHIHHETRKDLLEDKKLLEDVREIDGYFFSGGDQLRVTSIYGGSEFLTDLKQKYITSRIVVGGTSAGAMALSTPMIYAGNENVSELGGEIKVTTGLEFMKDVCIDTHFVHRGRFVRMAQVVVTNPTCIGFGIEEDTAVVVRDGIHCEVIGTGTVIIIEGFHIAEANVDDFSKERPITIRDLRVHLLSSGDKYEVIQINPPHK
jgi:cyanophycinase